MPTSSTAPRRRAGSHNAIRLLAAFAAAVGLGACRLDTEVLVEMEGDGTGTVTITMVADAELAGEVPDLAEQLDLGDVADQGWRIEGPSETDDGGARLVLAHDFRSSGEATELLRSLGPPLRDVRLRHRVEGDGDDATATNRLAGTVRLDGGFEAFSDEALTDAIGAMPFADELADRQPSDTMSITLIADLPGSVRDSNAQDAGGATWTLRLDGREQAIRLLTVQEPAKGSTWAGPVATIALVALVAWLIVSFGYLALVLARRRGR